LRGIARLAAVALGAASSAVAGEFVDPLDAPALPSPLAPRRLLNGVAAAGGRLVAVGQRGHALWSDDAGKTWTQASVPVSADLTAVHLATADRGWAVGHGGVVLATVDGGRSWVKQLDGRHPDLAASGEPERALLDVFLLDGRTGFAVGAFDLVLRTDDGGGTWRPWPGRTENPGALNLHAIGRAAGDVWVVGEQGLVLRLDAARERFRAVPLPYRGSLFGVAGNARTVLVYGLRGNAFRSRDRGASWQRADTGVEAALTGAAVLPDGRLVLVTLAGQLLVSADDGTSFRLVARERAAPASAVAAAGRRSLAVVGPAGVRVEAL
jgi:photosystem II stability/assembly factor-like uncharacterized protein